MPTIKDFEPFQPAESMLIAACEKGEIAKISQDRPTKPTSDNTVRADLIRFLAIHGAEQDLVHEHGVQLYGAWIEDALDLEEAFLPNSLGLFCCCFAKPINLCAADLQKSLYLNGSSVKGITADRLKVQGGVFLKAMGEHRFESDGEVRLLGASIGGNLECNGAKLHNPNRNSLHADGLQVQGGVFLSVAGAHQFESDGEVRLLGASIGGDLFCSGAKLHNPDGNILSADGLQVQGGVFLSVAGAHQFESDGEVRLLGASIGGDLSCNGAKLQNSSGDSLSADRLQVQGSVFLSVDGEHRFESDGVVRLLGASIGGNLDCEGAKLNNPNGYSLNAGGLKVQGRVFLCVEGQTPFESVGQVSFVGAFVKSSFIFKGKLPIEQLDMGHAQVGILADDLAMWGKDAKLDGFRYDSIHGDCSAQGRLDWLKKQVPADYGEKNNPEQFKPQPWQQLISVMRNMGHDTAADDVAIARENHMRDIGKMSGFAAWLHWWFGKLAGYGYKPLCLVGWMLGVWLAFSMVYFVAAYQGVFAPSNPLVFQNEKFKTCHLENSVDDKNWLTCGALYGEYTTFSPMAYSLDLILPLVDLGQEKDWGVYIDTPKDNALSELFCHWSLNHWVRILTWFEVLFGWMSSWLLVAVWTGLTNRDKNK